MGDEPRSDIQAAMSKMSSKVGSKREIKKLPEYLWEGERVDLITSGTYGAGTGIVVLTDRRLFFLKDGVMSKTSEDFPLGKISSVQWSSGMLMGKIIVFASGNKAEIVNVQKTDGKAITDAVRARLTDGAQSAEPSAQVAADAKNDVYEQLAKLGELRNSGVLTDAEFESKKAELLSRI
ncbi:MAG TPA: PH domain-containing protein [Kribbella sp.]|nr:PH domain-containing protein [Kribbella sp.]